MNARKLHRKFYTVTRLSGRVGQVAVTVRIPREGFDTPSPEWTPPAKWNGYSGVVDGVGRCDTQVSFGSCDPLNFETVIGRDGDRSTFLAVMIYGPDGPTFTTDAELRERFIAPIQWELTAWSALKPGLREALGTWRVDRLLWAPNGGGLLYLQATTRTLRKAAASLRRACKAAHAAGYSIKVS